MADATRTLRDVPRRHNGRAAQARRAEPRSRPGPLAGVRVLDFSWALVGSITTKVLGDLGCDVIKVEVARPPCLSRHRRAGERVARRTTSTTSRGSRISTRSKRSLALDMKQAREPRGSRSADRVGRRRRREFLAGHDGEARTRLRLARRSAIPASIMVSGSVFGQTGPLAQDWGVDGTGAALSGRTFLTGWPDRDPVIPGAVPYGDVIVPYVMAAAVGGGAACTDSDTGLGCHIDAAMYEICVQQMHAAIAAAANGERPSAAATTIRACSTRACIRRRARIAGSRSAVAQRAGVAQVVHPCGSRGHGIAHSSRRCLERVDPPTRRCRRWSQSCRRSASPPASCRTSRTCSSATRSSPRAARCVTLDHPLLGAFGHVRTPVTFSRSAVSPYRAPRHGRTRSRRSRASSRGLSAQRIAELEAAGVFDERRRRTRHRPAQPQGPRLHGGGHCVSRAFGADLKRRVVDEGEPFAIAQADTPHEIFHAMDIPLVSNQWWSAYISAKQLSHALLRRPRPARLSGATAADTARSDSPARWTTIRKVAPWGGLPKPTVLVARLTCDCIQHVFGQWAQALRQRVLSAGSAGVDSTRIRTGSGSRTTHWEEVYEPRAHRAARRRNARADRPARSADRPTVR